jgi:hypothetical protein
VKHPSKLPIDTLWSLFTAKFNRDHNLEKPGDAKQPEQLKVFSIKISEHIYKMFGGNKDFNHMKDMPPIASLVFAMKKERDEKIEKYNFVQKTIKENKEMVRKGKVVYKVVLLYLLVPLLLHGKCQAYNWWHVFLVVVVYFPTKYFKDVVGDFS